VPVTVLAAYPLSINTWPARTGHTDVVIVGRVTMESVDPHGFVGPLGDGDGAGSTEDTSAARATAFPRLSMERNSNATAKDFMN